MNYQSLLEEVRNYSISFFQSKQDKWHVYHNLAHTQFVVSSAAQIANHYRLTEKDFFIVLTAAWFHDAGYFSGAAAEHEQRGADMAAAFLTQKNVDKETIDQVKRCILVTRFPQQPQNLLEQIVCDADLFHLGTDDFRERNKLMHKEAERIAGKPINKSDWRKKTIELLANHHYHTDYVQLLLNDKKQQHLEKLLAKQLETTMTEKETGSQVTTTENHTPAVDGKKNKTDRPDRGIETVFRISSSNHQRLSDMADNKAHIMITTTSIIISVLLSLLLRKLEEFPNLVIPVTLLLSVCLITMVFSILATRPSLPHGSFTKEDIEAKRVNLLFFGNFYRMSLEDYTDGMQQMMASRDFLYGSLIKDVYSQGMVLGRKYRLLRVAYNVFMFGIVISVLAFLVASVFFN